MCVCVCIYIYVCVCVYIYIYIYIYIYKTFKVSLMKKCNAFELGNAWGKC